MKLPILATELFDYLPHRPPMVWIDTLEKCTPDQAVGHLLLKPDGVYLDGKVLRPSSFIELIGQTFALAQALELKHQNAPVKNRKAYLAAVKDFKVLSSQPFVAGDFLVIHVHRRRQLGPISLIAGEIFIENKLCAQGELRVFTG